MVLLVVEVVVCESHDFEATVIFFALACYSRNLGGRVTRQKHTSRRLPYRNEQLRLMAAWTGDALRSRGECFATSTAVLQS